MEPWFARLSPKAQMGFSVRLEYLRDRPVSQWNRPYAAPYSDGFIEVRFEVRNVQYRPLGFFGPARGDFTFVIPTEERGGQLRPPNALATAVTRRELILAHGGLARECTFTT